MSTHHTTLIRTLATLALFATATLTGRTVIAASLHDFSAKESASKETCIFCHTPQNAKSTLVPLWNRATTATASFTLYASSTTNATMGQPAGTSRSCLSCHDGAVACGAVAGTTLMTGTKKLGTDLSDDHPTSFTYDTALATADGGLARPFDASFVDAAKTLPLFAGKMECATCHDMHGTTFGKFLRMSNTGSALCLKCHVNK